MAMNYLRAEDVSGTVWEELPGLWVAAVAVAATRGRAHLVPVTPVLGHLDQGFHVVQNIRVSNFIFIL
jgi:hypothetical protein